MSAVSKTSSPTIPPGLPPADRDKPNPSGDGDGDKNTQLVEVVPPATEKSIANRAKIANSINKINNFLVAPTSFISAGSGLLSFMMPNFFDNQNELVDAVSKYSSKAAVGFTGISGIVHNFSNKNFFATLGYSSDIVTSIIADDKSLYPLRALGSALDQLPAMLKDSTLNPEVNKKYNKSNLDQKMFHEQFLNYKGFTDSIEKTLYSSKVVAGNVCRDIKDKYKSGGIFKALQSIFYISNGNKKEDSCSTSTRNLLISTAGLLGSVVTYAGFKMEQLGSTARDIFGLHADIGVWLAGQGDSNGSKSYDISGKAYTVGTVLDLASRWVPSVENLHLLALGVDRIGAYYMVKANFEQDYSPSKEIQTSMSA